MTVRLDRLGIGLADAINAAMTTSGFTSLAVFDRDQLPQRDLPTPYVVLDVIPTGFWWDRSLALTADSGICGVQAMSVGRARRDALWGLDEIRRWIDVVDPADVVLTDTTRVTAIWSNEPPTSLIVTGDFVTATETYYLHVEDN